MGFDVQQGPFRVHQNESALIFDLLLPEGREWVPQATRCVVSLQSRIELVNLGVFVHVLCEESIESRA